MAQNEEVVPSGQALKQVSPALGFSWSSLQLRIKPQSKVLQFSFQAATWLGISDPAKLLDDDPAAAFQPRPEGLGLGAKFLAHHKASIADMCFVTCTAVHNYTSTW